MKKCLFLMLMMISVNVMGQEDYFVSTLEDKPSKDSISAEKKFVEDNFQYMNIVDWKKGMRFMQVKKADPYIRPDVFSNTGKSLEEYYGQVLTMDTIVEEHYTQNRKDRIRTVIYLKSPSGDILSYKANTTIERLRDDRLYNCIDGLVPLDDVDKAKELLVGKTLYTLSNRGFKDTEKGARFTTVKKLAPYVVDLVGVGDIDASVKIIATDIDGNKAVFYVIFSGTNADSYAPILTNGYFYDVFSFANPRLKYSWISDEYWNLIMDSKVRIGMDDKSCRLSWGEPKKINKTTGSFGVHEQWVYENSYLYFENGKLTAIQD